MTNHSIKTATPPIAVSERFPGESAKDYVIRQLVYNIVHLRLLPGAKLDSAELSDAFNVSSNPVREAELALAQINLIEIKPKVGIYVTYIDTDVVDEIRELRSVLESQLAVKACDIITKEQIDRLWENVAMWQMYIKRNDEDKIFTLDKEFHAMLYHICGNEYWYRLVNDVSPIFDRTTILSFRCNEKNRILHDHEELVCAIENKDKQKCADIAHLHMTRYTENIPSMKKMFPEYFK